MKTKQAEWLWLRIFFLCVLFLTLSAGQYYIQPLPQRTHHSVSSVFHSTDFHESPSLLNDFQGIRNGHGFPSGGADFGLDDLDTASSSGLPSAVSFYKNSKGGFKATTTISSSGPVTTVWYDSPNEPSFKFSIKGNLPAADEDMINWIEKHKSKLQKTYTRSGEPVSPFQSQPSRPPTARPYTNTNQWKPPSSIFNFNEQYHPLAPSPNSFSASNQWKPPQSIDQSNEEYHPLAASPNSFPSRLQVSPWDGKWPVTCGKVSPGDKIIHGVPSRIENNPWQVALARMPNLDLFCGGTLITLRHVITAAHCFLTRSMKRMEEDEIIKTIRVIAGFYDIEDLGAPILIQRVFIHGKYGSHRRNDIALLFLEKSLTQSASVNAVCIPPRTIAYTPGRTCRATGWGKTEDERKPRYLLSADIPITTEEQCVAKNENISRGMFCAGDYHNGGKDSCQGDSGGPYVCNDDGTHYLYGITSWGRGCGQRHYPGVYTRVSVYLPWIKSRMVLTKDSQNRDANAHDAPEPDPDYTNYETPSETKDEEDDEHWDDDIL